MKSGDEKRPGRSDGSTKEGVREVKQVRANKGSIKTEEEKRAKKRIGWGRSRRERKDRTGGI